MRRGFTLIELLAVIVILAIISLIAVPIVLGIINDTKNKTDEQNVELYGRSIEQAVATYFVKHPEEDNVTIDKLEEENLINYKKKTVECNEIQIVDRKVFLSECSVDNKKIDYEYGNILIPGKLEVDADNNEKASIGDKYKYRVNKENTFYFYVLSLNSDNTLNLIMDRNICEDGTTNYVNSNNHCRYEWNDNTKVNNIGPVGSIKNLYNATKNWEYVPDMIIDYSDESNKDSLENGYTGITTDYKTKITTIKSKNSSNIFSIGTIEEPLKARLPKFKEITDCDCTQTSGSCPVWLIENLTYWSGANNKYNVNNNLESYQNYIYGYWLLSSNPDSNKDAQRISCYGNVRNSSSTSTNYYGIRPVITVPLNYLSN